MTVTHGTVLLEREYPVSIARAFEAWSSETAQRTWGDPGDGWFMSFDRFAFTVGDEDVCRFGPAGGPEIFNRNHYLEIVQDTRLVYGTSLETEGNLTFAGTVAVTFERSETGTTMRFVEQGLYLDGEDDVAGHQRGWEAMFDAMGRYLSGPIAP